MAIADKPEFPPLLELGFHPMSLQQLRALCVTPFESSERRGPMMRGLERFVERLTTFGVPCQAWIDGSFLTQKIEPDDVDLVVRMDLSDYEKADKDVFDWIEQQDHTGEFYCDAHALIVYPEGHELHDYGLWMEAFYHKSYGWSRDNIDTKGIAVLRIGG